MINNSKLNGEPAKFASYLSNPTDKEIAANCPANTFFIVVGLV